MVISFSHDTAYNQLQDYGYVVTFRADRRERPNCETWANRGRGKTKEFDVRVSEICRTEPLEQDIAVFAPVSGFNSPTKWRKAIRELNGDLSGEGYLYLVTREGV
jgi:hypothetical protein